MGKREHQLIVGGFVCALWVAMSSAAEAQPTLEQGRGMAWGSLGFQGDLAGSLNSSGIGTIGLRIAEIDANTWAERYDAALIFRVGGAYNLTDRSQVFAAVGWEQSEADTAVAGLVGGQPLEVKFSDYQGWGIDAGYRYFWPTDIKMKPFVSGSLGFQRIQDITISLSSVGFRQDEVPFYDDSWVTQWRIGAGFLWDITERFGWQVTLDIKYAGVLSDQSGIGTVGFERINDKGNRLTLPILVGAYAKF
jgi:hypothetical protein